MITAEKPIASKETVELLKSVDVTYCVGQGNPYPLGATLEESGVNFAIFSANATKIELCLFDQPYGEAEKFGGLMKVRSKPKITNPLYRSFISI